MLKEVYINNSQIPKRYLKDNPDFEPSGDDLQTFMELQSIQDNVKTFVDEGRNLLICSKKAGNGKTTWATRIARAYIDGVSQYAFPNDTPVVFINVNNFLNEKKLAINDKSMLSRLNKIEKSILSAKLVIFDDIADKTLSEYDMNTMYYWIDYRTSNLKSCIYTSNQLPEQLKATLNGKMYSRVVNYSQIERVTDGDHRKC